MKVINQFLYAVMFLAPLPSSFSCFQAIAKFQYEFRDEFSGVEPNQAFPNGLEDQIPPEVPRYILKTEKANIVIMGNRFDFHFIDSNISYETIEFKIKKINKVLVELDLPLFRIGIFLEGPINSEKLKRTLNDFVDFNALSSMEEWQLSYREIIEVESFRYNQWNRYFLEKNKEVAKYNYDINNINGIESRMIDDNNKRILKMVGEFIGS